MKELLLVITLIFCLILAVVWIGSIGAMVSGDCDINTMGPSGDLNDCNEKGFDLLYDLVGATPTPRPGRSW